MEEDDNSPHKSQLVSTQFAQVLNSIHEHTH